VRSLPIFEVALVIVATYFVFQFLAAASLIAFGDAPTLIIGELLILVVPLVYLLGKKVNVWGYVRLNLKPKFVLIGLGCGGLLLFLNLLVSDVLTYFLGTSNAVEASNKLIVGLSVSPSGLVAVGSSLVLAGVCEEFAFRGFLQNSIFRSLSSGKSPRLASAVAIVIAAAVFGIFHFDPQGVYTISAFVSGLALGLIYYRWNYTASATAHASMNLIVLALLLLGIA